MNAKLNFADVVRVGPRADDSVRALVARYEADLVECADSETLPGSYWGDSEAGLRGSTIFVRADTPLHSLLHELGHFICMSPERRAGLDRDAGGDDAEECGVCYLQILLADEIAGFGRARMLADMDSWGYTFRLGSARAWFEKDAADACIWLRRHGVVDGDGHPTFHTRS
ncbi:MAG TPA: hypothetical protein VMF52_07000 [Steroidobacteraceae bacterium]|nr:hypothetical protein [Steroidobacteraceae bacterium]